MRVRFRSPRDVSWKVIGRGIWLQQCSGLWHIARQQVVECRHVSSALNVGMSAQCHDPPTRTPNVAQQQLHHRSCADDLHTLGLLCPSNSVTEDGGALTSRVFYERLGNQLKLLT